MEPTIQKYSNTFAVGACRHVVVNILRGKPSVSSLDILIEWARKVAAKYPEGQYIINILEPSAFLPGPDERHAQAEKIKQLEQTTKAVNLFVIEATGFGAVAFRAVLAGQSFLSGSAQEAFPTVDEAIAFAMKGLPTTEQTTLRADLKKTVEALRTATGLAAA